MRVTESEYVDFALQIFLLTSSGRPSAIILYDYIVLDLFAFGQKSQKSPAVRNLKRSFAIVLKV